MRQTGLSFLTLVHLRVRYFIETICLVLLPVVLSAGVVMVAILIFRTLVVVDRSILITVALLLFTVPVIYAITSAVLKALCSFDEYRVSFAKLEENQKLLKEFIEKDTKEEVRLAALPNMKNSDVLADVIRNGSSLRLQQSAAKCSIDSNTAKRVVYLAADPIVRANLVSHIKDEDVLEDLAQRDADHSVRREAASRIESAERLLGILRSSDDTAVWYHNLPRLAKKITQNGKLPREITEELRQSPLAEEWFQRNACPYCFSTHYICLERECGEVIDEEYIDPYCVSYKKIYETVYACGSCHKESASPFFVPFSCLIMEEADIE